MREIRDILKRTNETITRTFDGDRLVSMVGVHNVTGKVRYIFPSRAAIIANSKPPQPEEDWSQKEPVFDRAYIRSRIKAARAGALRRGIEFDIVTQDIYNLLAKQKNRCYYSGLMFIDARGFGNFGAANKFAFSIDRMDSAKGYTRDNTVLCLNIINTSKGHLDAEEFIQRCWKETRDAYRAVGWDKEPTIEGIFGYVISSSEYNDAVRKMRALEKSRN